MFSTTIVATFSYSTIALKMAAIGGGWSLAFLQNIIPKDDINWLKKCIQQVNDIQSQMYRKLLVKS